MMRRAPRISQTLRNVPLHSFSGIAWLTKEAFSQEVRLLACLEKVISNHSFSRSLFILHTILLGMDSTIFSTHTLKDYKEHSGLNSQRVKHLASQLICITLSTKLLNSSVCPSRRAGNSAGLVMHWQTTKPSSRCYLLMPNCRAGTKGAANPREQGNWRPALRILKKCI